MLIKEIASDLSKRATVEKYQKFAFQGLVFHSPKTMTGDKTAKWFTAIPLQHTESPVWWEREAGVLCLGFRELGIDARFVLLGASKPHTEPFVFASLADLQSCAWWKQWSLTGVVLYSGGAPRYEPIARAIKDSGTKLVIRMDTDGMCSPRVSFWRYVSITSHSFKDARKKFTLARALAKALIFRYFPSAFERGFHAHLGHADCVVVESPIAEQRLKRFFKEIGAGNLSDRLLMIPPQISTRFTFDPTVSKRRQIIAVGRWDFAQKDASMLMSSLAQALAADLSCEAIIAGCGEEVLQRSKAGMPEGLQARISILGRVGHERLVQYYREAMIIFFPSRFEGFPNSAVEALSCGCSVVGPSIIAAMNYCTMPACGTVACRRTPEDFSDALLAELGSWDRGERKPEEFSVWWGQQASPNVAKRLMEVFELVKPMPPS